MKSTIHESTSIARMGPAPVPSDRHFGFALSVLLGIWSAFAAVFGNAVAPVLAAIGLLVIALALLRPVLLGPVKHAWLVVGTAIHQATSLVILSTIFYFFISVFGVVLRWIGAISIHRRDGRLIGTTYWVRCRSKSIPSESFRNQF